MSKKLINPLNNRLNRKNAHFRKVVKRFRYDHFRVLTNDVSCFGGQCPLCGAMLRNNVLHECSNGKTLPADGADGSPAASPEAKKK